MPPSVLLKTPVPLPAKTASDAAPSPIPRIVCKSPFGYALRFDVFLIWKHRPFEAGPIGENHLCLPPGNGLRQFVLLDLDPFFPGCWCSAMGREKNCNKASTL
jgi:hypothetical protein